MPLRTGNASTSDSDATSPPADPADLDSDDSAEEYVPEKDRENAKTRGRKRRRREEEEEAGRSGMAPAPVPPVGVSEAGTDATATGPDAAGAAGVPSPESYPDPTSSAPDFDPSASLGLPPLDPAYVPPSDLTSWLSLKPVKPLLLPALLTTSSPIFDKDSIFLAYAMACPPELIDARRMHDGQARARKIVEGLVKLLPHDHKGLPDVVAGRGEEVSGKKRRKKIKPSHNMWAYRCLTLMPNRSGTSDTDYTTAEDAHDDGERWGGERLGKVLRDEGAADVLLVCSRWFGGTLIGPARFQHIENTARSALSLYDTRSALEPLYTELETLDALILEFRRDLAPDAQGVAGKTVPDRAAGIPSYRMITEVRKLENLIKVRGRTVQFLGDQVAERELVLGGAVLAEEGSGAGGEPAQAP